MKSLSRLESLIAEIVERPAWGLASPRLHPLELTAALVKAMEVRAIRLADRILAPDRYDLRLNADDLQAFGDAQPVLERELGEYLLRTYEERDLSCNLPPVVRLISAADVKQGKVGVIAGFSPPADEQAKTILGRPPRSRPTPAVQETLAVARAAPARVAAPVEVSAPARLELIGPDGAVVRTYPLDRTPLLIGRRSTTDIPLLDAGVSREHARVERTEGGYTVVDLNSTNGTFVNGRQVHGPLQLRDGDVLGVGRYQMRFTRRGV